MDEPKTKLQDLKTTVKRSRPAPIVRGIQLDQDDYDLINTLWIQETVIPAADGAAIASGRYFLYKNGQLPRVQRVFLQRMLEKLRAQAAEEAKNPYTFNRNKQP